MSELSSLMRSPFSHPLTQQFLRFAAVGGVAVLVHYSIMIALVELAAWPVVVASTLGFTIGAVVSYGLNRIFTFVGSSQPLGLGFVKFSLVVGVGLLMNGAIVALLHGWGLPYMLAQATATGLVTFWNFGANRALVFHR